MIDKSFIGKDVVKEMFNCGDNAVFESCDGKELTLTEYAKDVLDDNDRNDWNFKDSIREILKNEEFYELKEEK